MLDQRAKIDRLEPRAGQLGIGPRGLADVTDQSVEPNHILPHHIEQLLAKIGIVDPVETIDRAPQ